MASIINLLKQNGKTILEVNNNKYDISDIIQRSKTIISNKSDFYSKWSYYHSFTNVKSKSIAVYNTSFKINFDRLLALSRNSEIEHVLEIITTDSIVYDDDGYFIKLRLTDTSDIKDGKYLEIKDYVYELCDQALKHVYNLLSFKDSDFVTSLFKKFLTIGYVVFEIIYDYDNMGNKTNIIGFRELDPKQVVPEIDPQGNIIWRVSTPQGESILSDDEIIYISYSDYDWEFVSFVHKIERPFNILRIVENTKIIWMINHSPLRMKVKVPVESNNFLEAYKIIDRIRAYFEEDVVFDLQSGQLYVNGSPGMSFQRVYYMPAISGGGEMDVDTLKWEGFDMERDEIIKYFDFKFKRATGIPLNRFDYNKGGGVVIMANDRASIENEEARYNRLIQRYRRRFEEIILKPLKIQFLLLLSEKLNIDNTNDFINNPHKYGADSILNKIWLQWNNNNVIEEIKMINWINMKLDLIDRLRSVTLLDGETPVFSVKYLLKQYLNIDDKQFKELISGVKDEFDLIAKIRQQLDNELDNKFGKAGGRAGGGFGSEFGGLGGFSGGLGDELGGEEINIGGPESGESGPESGESGPEIEEL